MKKLFFLAFLLSGILAFTTWAEAKDVKLAYTESVPVAKVEAAARDYASRGYNPVILHCGPFVEATLRAAKAKEAALAQIDNGADVIFGATDQAARGIFSAAQSRKVYVIASCSDQASLAPNTILTSVLYDLPR